MGLRTELKSLKNIFSKLSAPDKAATSLYAASSAIMTVSVMSGGGAIMLAPAVAFGFVAMMYLSKSPALDSSNSLNVTLKKPSV